MHHNPNSKGDSLKRIGRWALQHMDKTTKRTQVKHGEDRYHTHIIGRQSFHVCTVRAGVRVDPRTGAPRSKTYRYKGKH